MLLWLCCSFVLRHQEPAGRRGKPETHRPGLYTSGSHTCRQEEGAISGAREKGYKTLQYICEKPPSLSQPSRNPQPPYSMSGQLSQVNMWRRVLSHEEILSLTRCEVDLEGDIISWSGPWKLYNVEEKVLYGGTCSG